jgi:glutamyl-tRNA reductase
VLSKLLQQALRTGKRVRHETTLGDGILSHGSLVARMLNREAATLTSPALLIIGAGRMARSALLSLERERFGRVWVANRTPERAKPLAEQADAEAIGLEAMAQVLPHADFVISAVSVERPLLRPEHLGGTGKPLALFDLSLPRSIHPSAAELGLRLHTLDDLEAILSLHRAERQAAIPQAEQIVREELSAFAGWLEARAVVPTVQALRQRFEELRQAELMALSPAERAVAERVTHRLVQKLLHQPLTRLRELAQQGQAEPYQQALQALFELEKR